MYLYIYNYICMHIYVIGVVSVFVLDSYLWRCRGGRIRWWGTIVAVLGRGGFGGGGRAAFECGNCMHEA
jgi:hypothetical protein